MDIKCPECKQEMKVGIDGKYHHYYLLWNGTCTAKTVEELTTAGVI
jgi:hypothetical protein